MTFVYVDSAPISLSHRSSRTTRLPHQTMTPGSAPPRHHCRCQPSPMSTTSPTQPPTRSQHGACHRQTGSPVETGRTNDPTHAAQSPPSVAPLPGARRSPAPYVAGIPVPHPARRRPCSILTSLCTHRTSCCMSLATSRTTQAGTPWAQATRVDPGSDPPLSATRRTHAPHESRPAQCRRHSHGRHVRRPLS